MLIVYIYSLILFLINDSVTGSGYLYDIYKKFNLRNRCTKIIEYWTIHYNVSSNISHTFIIEVI